MRTPGSINAGRWGTIVVLAALLTGGCGTQPTQSPALPASPAVTPAPTRSPDPVHADTLRVGYRYDWFPAERQASTAIPGFGTDFGYLVHAALYRLDARFDVLPDVADGACCVPGGMAGSSGVTSSRRRSTTGPR